MKIGFLVKTVNPKNGAGRYASDIIEGLRVKGHTVIVLKEEDDGYEGEVVLKRGIQIFSGVRGLAKKLEDCDVIHAIDGYPYGIIGWLINRKLQKKLVISALGTYAVAPLYRWQTAFMLKQAYKKAHRVIAISTLTKNKILEKITLSNIVVVNPGIKIEKHSESRELDEQYILGVGALKERKGYHIALSAFAEIAQEFPELRYKIVADPDRAYKVILEAFLKDRGLFDRVDFLSFIPEESLADLYEKASIFVLTPINTTDNHFEGFGIVYLEAASYGLPVIGTLGSGGEDAIQDGVNGILVQQGDVKETAEAMRKILLDVGVRNAMIEKSFGWAQCNTVEMEVNAVLKVYQS